MSPSMKDEWDHFCETATVHGFPFIYSSGGWVKKSVWTFFSIVCLGLLVYNVTTLTLLYFQYPVKVKLGRVPATKVTFPAVTVCNTNPIKNSLVGLSPLLSGVLQDKRRKRRDTGGGIGREKRSADPDCTTAVNSNTGSCYWIEAGSMTQPEAVAACEAKGGYLGHIKEEATEDFLHADGLLSGEAWISLNDEVTDDVWLWGDGETATFFHWKDGQPTGEVFGQEEKCVRTKFEDDEIQWYDSPCVSGFLKFTALCEKGGQASAVETTVAAIVTTIAETTTVAATTLAETTTVVETTPLETTTFVETTSIETTTVVETTPLETTTVAETTSIETTTVAETTPVETTTVAETTHVEITTEAEVTSDGSITTQVAETTTSIIPTSQYEDREPLREDFLTESDLIEALADTPEEIKVQMGYRQDEFILDCTFAGQECAQSDFESFFNAVHGNCYTFNADWNENSTGLYETSRTGASAGLSMMVNINQGEYLASGGQGAGVVVVVHSGTRMPFPEDEGLLARPNRLSAFEITRREVERLGPPYGDCIKGSDPQPKRNVYEEQLPVHYSTLACSKTCYQRSVIDECGCADAQFPMRGKAFGGFAGNACDVRNTTQDDCMYGVELRYIKDELDCDCPDVCGDMLYPAPPSVSLWPSQVEMESVANYLVQSHNINATDPEAYIKRNIIKLEFYFRDLTYDITTELPKYRVATLMTSIAGSMGLFLGCTVYSVVEPLLFLLHLIQAAIMCCRRRKKNNRINSVDEAILENDRDISGGIRPGSLRPRPTNHIAWD